MKTPKMSAIVELDVLATQRLLQLICSSVPHLDYAQVETALGIGSDGLTTSRSGDQVRRYLRGPELKAPNQRALSALKRDQMLLAALRLGWPVYEIFSFSDSRRAAGRLLDVIQMTPGSQERNSRIQKLLHETPAWRERVQNRQKHKSIERHKLRTLIDRYRQVTSALIDFLGHIDGKGFDGWIIGPDPSLGEQWAHNEEVLLNELREMAHRVAQIRLGVSESWSADTVDEARGLFPLAR